MIMRVLGKIQNWPIQRKLLLIIFSTIAASLILVLAGIVAYEISTYRSRQAQEMTSLAGFIVANSAPPLAFDDAQTAQEILNTLKGTPAVVTAALYTREPRLLASYVRSGERLTPPPRPGAEGARFAGRYLELVRPIEAKGRRIGTLYLRADLVNVYYRLRGYASIFLVVTAAIMGGGFLLQRLLQRLISEPLLQLSSMADNIAGGDLSTHIEVRSTDEIGQLASSFNHMSSELARSYTQLRESEARFRALVAASSDVLYRMSPDWSEMLQLDSQGQLAGTEQPSGDWIHKYIHPDDQSRVLSAINEAIRTKSTFELEHEVLLTDGSVGWTFSRAIPIQDQKGKITEWFGAASDITDRKRAEKEREELIQELERSNRELQQFAYVSSHDLQEPLRTITVYAQLVQNRYQGKLDEKGAKYLTYMFNAATRMSSLITDLLAFSRVGSRVEPFQPVEMESVLNDVLTNLKVTIEESGAEITHDPLPQVEGDRGQLTQLLQNLVANGLKYQKKEAAPRVSISVERLDDEWLFGVHDNGIGIDPQFYDRIFIIFQRLHKREEYSGTGMGLAICRKIVERHGGRIWVESRPGEGASFYFSLPVRKE